MSDAEFKKLAKELAGRQKNSSSILLLIIVTLVLVVFVWASATEIDNVVRGSGKTVSEAQNQLVQSSEPGVIIKRYVSEGDYVEIIFLGPSTERDALGKVADLVFDPVGFLLNPWQSRLRSTANVGNVLGNRAALGSTIDSVLYDSADSYSQTKLAYLQGRRFRLNPEISEVYSDPYEEWNE